MATIRDVARRAGVSHTAVSEVINGNGKKKVGPEKHKRILEAIDELGYVPSRVAQQLVTGKSNTVAICFEMPFSQILLHPTNSSIIAAVGDFVHADGQSVLVASAAGRGIEQVMKELPSQGVLGVVVAGGIDLKKSVLEAIDGCGVPAVCIDSYPGFSRASTVDVDNVTAVRQATEYLISQGHHRITYIGGPPVYQYHIDRMTGFCGALQEHGIRVTERSIYLLEIERVEEVVTGALNSDERPTAIICGTASYGAAAARAVGCLGLRVPDDISFMTFDIRPPGGVDFDAVSLIRTKPYERGHSAADLLKKITSGEIDAPINLRIPIDLDLRPSPAPVAEAAGKAR